VKKTEGAAALAVVNASGWNEITSRPFKNTETGTVANTLRVDVFVPEPQPNTYWVGDLQASVNCPSLGLNSRHLGISLLTTLPRGQWSTVRMPILEEIADPLRTRTYSDCTLKLMLNVSSNAGRFVLDNLAWKD
jgi:hypothetical protein